MSRLISFLIGVVIGWFLMGFILSSAKADSISADFNFGENTQPSYGMDYQQNIGKVYFDYQLSLNNSIQGYISTGLQFEVVNIGVGTSFNSNGFEFGLTKNLNDNVFLKENSTLLFDHNGILSTGETLAIGSNL